MSAPQAQKRLLACMQHSAAHLLDQHDGSLDVDLEDLVDRALWHGQDGACSTRQQTCSGGSCRCDAEQSKMPFWHISEVGHAAVQAAAAPSLPLCIQTTLCCCSLQLWVVVSLKHTCCQCSTMQAQQPWHRSATRPASMLPHLTQGSLQRLTPGCGWRHTVPWQS